MNLRENHPLTYGLGNSIGIFYRGKPIFETSLSYLYYDIDRRVIGYFPEKDILLSGYLNGEKHLSNKTAMLWMKKAKGQFIFMGFSPIFRASTTSNYKLLFNSILLPKLKSDL